MQRVDTVRVHARLRVKMRVEATRVCCRSFVYTRGTVLLGLRGGDEKEVRSGKIREKGNGEARNQSGTENETEQGRGKQRAIE